VGIVSFAAIESNSNRWVRWLGRAVRLTPGGAAACFVNDFVILGLHEAGNICNSENSGKEEKARAAGNRPDPEPLDSITRRIMDSYRWVASRAARYSDAERKHPPAARESARQTAL